MGKASEPPYKLQNRYRLTRMLGSGLYCAHDDSLDREVVIRFVDSATETGMNTALNHPHIAAIYGAGTEAGWDYVVLEYVEGEPLDIWAARRESSQEDVVYILRQVLSALDYAHQRNVIHGKLGRKKIIVIADHPQPFIKVLDFGGKGQIRDDLYAVGGLAHDLLTNLDGDAQIMQVVEKLRASRYPSAGEAQNDLEGILGTPHQNQSELALSSIESGLTESLNLLVAQATVYQSTLSGNPQAQMVASVLGSLGQQAQQRIREVMERLKRNTLEMLGLQPALEALASQIRQHSGAHITLDLERLQLPESTEAMLFQAAQLALEQAIRTAQITLRLRQTETTIRFEISGTGLELGQAAFSATQRWTATLGGNLERQVLPGGGSGITIVLPMHRQEFTQREAEVLRLLAAGSSNKQIAAALQISVRTVGFHLDNIYSKLGVNSRAEAIVRAMQYGLHKPG